MKPYISAEQTPQVHVNHGYHCFVSMAVPNSLLPCNECLTFSVFNAPIGVYVR